MSINDIDFRKVLRVVRSPSSSAKLALYSASISCSFRRLLAREVKVFLFESHRDCESKWRMLSLSVLQPLLRGSQSGLTP
jgi:hypothetical protein